MKKDKKFEQWENSIEGILYSLSSMGDVTQEDVRNNDIIAQVLQKLPKKVREKVLEEVIFIHTTAYGTVRRLYFQKFIEETKVEKITGDKLIKSSFLVKIPKSFIIFNFKCIRNAETKMNTIAHEIAHFIRSPKDPCKTRPADIEEKEADDLVEKWGFKRGYKSYKRFKGAVSGMNRKRIYTQRESRSSLFKSKA